jgi:EmrB/QacA subfamily drug resistance transporter
MSRRQRWLLVTLLLGVFMGALDIFIVAPALGSIQSGLHISSRVVTWTLTAYTLVYVVSQPLVGKLSDRFGRRWVYVACVAVFGAGSLMSAHAGHFSALVIGRCVQAIGAGGIIPVASAVIADVFPPARRGAALGIVGSVFGLALIIGPVLGSLLTAGVRIGTMTTDWHSLFLVNVPLAVAIVLLAARLLPREAPRQRARMRFDWNGAVLLALALFCIIFGLTQIDFASWSANFTGNDAVPVVLCGLALLVPFWLNEQSVADPIVDVRAFSRRQLVIAMCLSAGAGIITSSIVFVPQLVEATFHLKSGEGGYSLVAVALALFLGTPVVGRLIDRRGSRSLLLAGAAITGFALALMLAAGSSPGTLVAALLLVGAGLATFTGTPLRYIVLNEAAPRRRAASLAVLSVCNSVGQTLALPLGGAIIASTARSRTVPALHAFYLIVLGVVLLGLLLALGLKTRASEVSRARPHRVESRLPSPALEPMEAMRQPVAL